MYNREPHKGRFWRLLVELKEDGILETDSEEETESDSGEEGSGESESDYGFNDEEDWWLEQQAFEGL